MYQSNNLFIYNSLTGFLWNEQITNSSDYIALFLCLLYLLSKLHLL